MARKQDSYRGQLSVGSVSHLAIHIRWWYKAGAWHCTPSTTHATSMARNNPHILHNRGKTRGPTKKLPWALCVL